MKIAAHTMSTPHLNPFEAIELYASIGFDAVDLICDDDYPCGIPPNITSSKLSDIKRHADHYGLVIANLTPYLRSINSFDESLRRKHIDGLKHCIELSNSLGAKSMRIWAGDEPSASEWDASFDVLVESLLELGQFAQDHNVQLNVENHQQSMALKSEDTARIIEAVNMPSVGILYDPANLFVNGESDYLAAFERQKEYIGHVHVKNVSIYGHYKYLPTLLDEGVVPWAEIVYGLNQIGYDHYLSIEYEKRWHPELLPESAVGLRYELRTLRRFISENSRGRANPK